MKNLLSFLILLLVGLSGYSQPYTYRQSVINGDTLVYRIDFNGNTVRVQHLPTDKVKAKIGLRRLNAYTLENKASFNTLQFGTGKYYDPNYFFSADINVNLESVSTRQGQGVTMFSRFVATESEYGNLPPPKRFYYQTENELHGPLEGAKYYESDLATVESWLYNHIPSNVGYWVANIETSNEWHQWQYQYGPFNHGYDSWDVAKQRSITSERTGQPITLEALWNSGQWDQEMQVRRNNRLAIMMTIARARNDKAAYGASMFQAEPRTNSLQTTNLFKEGTADVSKIGGTGDGTITLNGRTYTGINKNVYAYENSMLDYFYYFGWADFAVSDYNDIWINKLPGTQTMPYIWSKMVPYHIVASEKGHWQANKYRMLNIPGQTNRGTVRMQEPNFEDKFYLTDGRSIVSFVPFQELQNIDIGGYLYTPKVWLPPYYFYSAYAVHRFLEGSTPGSGYHLWHTPGTVRLPVTHPLYNHHLHSVTSLFQARNDLQPLERFYAGSTLVQDPEVQINQTGSWSAYSGCEAFAFGPDGGRGTQKPAYIVRYKQTTSGWQVYILGGMKQGYSESRTDLVRIPGGGLNGNMFRVTLKGPAAHLYEFTVSSTDSNQTYDAANTITTPAAGYAGRTN